VTDDRLQDLLEDALDALDADDPEKAQEILDVAYGVARHHPQVVELRAETLTMLDRGEEAEQMIDEALKARGADAELVLAAAAFRLDHSEGVPARVTAALELAAKGEKLARMKNELELAGEFLRVQGRAHAALADLAASAKAFEGARQLLGDDDELLVELGIAWFEVLRLDDAKRLLTAVVQRRPDDPDAHHYLGLIAERENDPAAGRHFAEARRLDPEAFPKPFTLSDEAFTKAIEDALAALPEEVRQHLANVPVMVEPLPRPEDLGGDPLLSPLSLGMFRGTALGERSVMDPWTQLPASILLFKTNLERYATSRDELVQEIETTLFHEIGHFMGWNEDELFERGLD
jgi:predicted Zn-dependent protease with MMP-like domain